MLDPADVVIVAMCTDNEVGCFVAVQRLVIIGGNRMTLDELTERGVFYCRRTSRSSTPQIRENEERWRGVDLGVNKRELAIVVCFYNEERRWIELGTSKACWC